MRTQSLLIALCAVHGARAFAPAPARVAAVARRPAAATHRGRRSFPAPLAATVDENLPPSQVENLVANAKALVTKVYPKGPASAQRSLVAGFTVMLAMVPEAVAFSFVCGVSPITALWSTVTVGFCAAAFGGRPGIMSGASGACAVVMAACVAQYGPVYLSAGVLLAGLLQIGAGAAGLGKFIRITPLPVMLGFVNGLAIVMTKAQLTHFFTPEGALIRGARGATMAGLTALTMALVKFLPKVTTAVPPSLAAIGLTTLAAKLFNLPAKTLVDVAGKATFSGGLAVLPKLALPAIPAASAAGAFGKLLPFAVTMGAVGLVESLLTMQLVDGIVDDGTRGSTRMECIGQGLGNVLSGLTGGMGGCALVGQSLINVESGGTSRLSGMAMSAFLGLGIVGAAPLLGAIPVASLVGIMLLVCKETFNWSSLRVMRKIPKTDAAVIVLVSLVTVFEDLAVATLAGVLVSALSFTWKLSTAISAGVGTDDNAGWKSYKLQGPLFFGSTQKFSDLFDVKNDGKDVVIDFAETRVMDHSALEAVNELADRYGAAGKTVHLRGLSTDCAKLLKKLNGEAKPYEIFEAAVTDPVYEVASDRSQYENKKYLSYAKYSRDGARKAAV